MCLYEFFFKFSYLVFSELPRFVVCCLTFTWKNSQILLQFCLSSFLFQFPLLFSLFICYTTVVIVPLSLDTLLHCFISYFLFAFEFWWFLLRYYILQLRDLFPPRVQCINEPIYQRFSLYYCVLYFQHSFCLHYPFVLECSFLFPLIH